MSDLHRRRSSGLALLFVLFTVVCVHTTFAETPNSSPSVPEVATLPTTTPLSPQTEGDLLMVHRKLCSSD